MNRLKLSLRDTRQNRTAYGDNDAEFTPSSHTRSNLDHLSIHMFEDLFDIPAERVVGNAGQETFLGDGGV